MVSIIIDIHIDNSKPFKNIYKWSMCIYEKMQISMEPFTITNTKLFVGAFLDTFYSFVSFYFIV